MLALPLCTKAPRAFQALDLLGRKVLLATKGQCVRDFTKEMLGFAAKLHCLDGDPVGRMAREIAKRAVQWNVITTRLMLRAAKDRDTVSSACYDYLMYSGFVTMGYFWAQQAQSQLLLSSGQGKGTRRVLQGQDPDRRVLLSACCPAPMDTRKPCWRPLVPSCRWTTNISASADRSACKAPRGLVKELSERQAMKWFHRAQCWNMNSTWRTRAAWAPGKPAPCT